MAAIDGHAKNYSLFLESDSAYRMAPLYDVLSAYPLMTQGSIPAEKAKALIDEMAQKTEAVIAHIHSILPSDFPNHISQPILEGLREQARKLR